MRHSRILGIGHYVPPRVLTNHDLEALMDTSDEWIRQRTGIEERRVVEPGVPTSELAFQAAQNALAHAQVEAKDVDLIVVATLSPDYYFPGVGVLLQDRLGAREIPALDIRQQCSGFVYGLSIADQYIRTGTYERVLVVGAEVQSAGLDYTTRGRDLAVIFGDGAAAVVLGPSEEPGVISVHLHSQGKYFDMLWLEKPGSQSAPTITAHDLEEGRHFPHMEGQTVFKHATRRFAEAIHEVLSHNGTKVEDIDLFFFHQANLRIIDAISKMIGIPPEKSFNNLQRYGNTTAASIPLCMSEAVEQGRLQRGQLVCPVAFGSGFTWGSALIRW
ncbi:MAG: ketoacyl-ACP synthase III [Candidatus Eisenbacteria bacterium]|uniref:Beta-ketoacyl-[acyl-carrier-protein] synthase III n=1 Tax=Eiseniibacteriota bacterium TaxID=2212470 RepID=A0A956RN27_UNCEI|nr:ketoacyl-ACP synthase III [Candidatus Eisenbacteria bacterium]